MFKIVASRAGHREIVDREEDRAVACALCAEYQMALGPTFLVRVLTDRTPKHDASIVELRAAGLTNAQIAERIGLKRGTVDAYTSRLHRSGLIPKRRGGAQEKKTERNNRIVALYRIGLKTREIADRLDMSYYAVRTAIYTLRRKGRL
jgi:DNA-binding CsgD family transcriptional regulator